MHDPRIRFNRYNESRVVFSLHFAGNHENFLTLVLTVPEVTDHLSFLWFHSFIHSLTIVTYNHAGE